jgi:hypothetical protein
MSVDVAVAPWTVQSCLVEQVTWTWLLPMAARYSIAQSSQCPSHSYNTFWDWFGLNERAHGAVGGLKRLQKLGMSVAQ